MPPPRDSNEIEQTLLPGAPAKAAPAKPADADTPARASDATVNTPANPSVVADPGETLPTAARPAPVPPAPRAVPNRSAETHDGVEATLLPSSTGRNTGAPGTIVGADPTTVGGEIGATLPTPVGRTIGAGGSAGALGSDTGPLSASGAPALRGGASPSDTGTMVGRFALKGLHASGGLGEVFTARDTELNREVAVKRIKSRYADDPGSRHRFLTEAELTARLDHPGVVPVFGLVNDVRGRPCYAMRFIRGETLKDEIERYHGLKKPGEQKPEDRGQKTEQTDKAPGKTAEQPAPGLAASPEGTQQAATSRAVAFRQLLARFIATCQAIGYAHSRGIIHRDIKPANIMVGTFGETLVVDWGLAKSMADGPDFDRVMKAAADAGFRHDPDATDMPSHMTQAGTAVGTPAYMAPEQAAGEIDKVGPKADVYALGTTLYVILTGHAPFAGKTTAEVLDAVRRGAYTPAASASAECPKPLDAIARKAMALRQEDRYATALDLAADVERWLSDEPVSCYRDPVLARLARWARRHPARVAAAVSLLLAGVIAAVGIAVVYQQGEKQTRAEQEKTAAERDKVIEQEKKTALALVDVQKQRDKVVAQEKLTDEQRKQAVAARNVARERYEKAVGAYNVLVTDIDKKMADRAQTQDLRKTLLLSATEGLKQLVAGGGEGKIGADRTLVAAYRQMGDVYERIGETAKARENFQIAVDRAGDVRDEAQKAGTPADKRAADRDLARSLHRLAGILRTGGDTKTALAKIDDALKMFIALAEDKADTEAQGDLAAARDLRSKILMDRGETGKALDDSGAALAARKALHEAKPADPELKRDFAASLDATAVLQLRTGRTKEALANAQLALTARTELAKALVGRTDATRDLAAAHSRLGEVSFERGQMTAARQSYLAGTEVLTKLVTEDPKSVGARADLAALYGRVSQVQLRTGDIADAVNNAKRGKELAEHLEKDDKDSADARRDHAQARERYGDALLAADRPDEALAEFAAAEGVLRHLRGTDAESATAKLDLARGLERRADGLVAKGDMNDAIVALVECVKIREEVAAKDTGSATAKRDLAMGLFKLADTYCTAGQPGRADGIATRAAELFVQLSDADPDSAQARRDVALGFGKWGQVLVNGGHVTGALIVWQSAQERCAALSKVDAANLQAKEDEATAWERLAGFYARQNNSERALAAAKTAVEQWTAIAAFAKTKSDRRRLALAMLRCGDISTEIRQLPTARDWYKRAAEQANAPADPLLGPVAKRAAEQQSYVDAVEAGLKNPNAVLDAPEAVRVPALRTVATIELRADHPTTAASAATLLAKEAKLADDLFAAARTFAGTTTAARLSKDVKDDYAAQAVAALERAIAAGFRDADSLTAPEWDAVRTHAPAFTKVRAGLLKLIDGK